MNNQNLQTEITIPNFSHIRVVIGLILISIVFFALYPLVNWWMSASCLCAYGCQIFGLLSLVNQTQKMHIDVSDYPEILCRIRKYKIKIIALIFVLILIDLFPFIAYAIFVNSLYTLDVSDYSWRFAYVGGTFVFILSLVMILINGLIIRDRWNCDKGLKQEYASFLSAGKTKEQQEQENLQIKKDEQDKVEQQKREKYGNSYKEIKVYHGTLIVSEERSLLSIDNVDYQFKDILNAQISDNPQIVHSASTATTRTKTGSMVGRAIVGDIIAGPVGGIIGGSTAKKTTHIGESHSKTVHDYYIYMTINDMSNPVVKIAIGNDEECLNTVYALLQIIIKKNNDGIQS